MRRLGLRAICIGWCCYLGCISGASADWVVDRNGNRYWRPVNERSSSAKQPKRTTARRTNNKTATAQKNRFENDAFALTGHADVNYINLERDADAILQQERIDKQQLFNSNLDWQLKIKWPLGGSNRIGISTSGIIRVRDNDRDGTSRMVNRLGYYYENEFGTLSYGNQAGNAIKMSAGYYAHSRQATELVQNPFYLTAPMLPTQYYIRWFQDNYDDPYLGEYEAAKISYVSKRVQGLKLALDYWTEDSSYADMLTHVLAVGINYSYTGVGYGFLLSLVAEGSDAFNFIQGVHSVELGAKGVLGNFSLSAVHGRIQPNLDNVDTTEIINNAAHLDYNTRFTGLPVALAQLQLHADSKYSEIALGYNISRFEGRLAYFTSEMNGFYTRNIRARLRTRVMPDLYNYVEAGSYRLEDRHNYDRHPLPLDPSLRGQIQNVQYFMLGFEYKI